MSLKRRVDKLETCDGSTAPQKSEFELRVEAAWELYAEPLAQTMSEPHARTLLYAIDELNLDWLQGARDEGAFWLYHLFRGVILSHWHEGAPLALPHVVGEAAMHYRATTGSWDCADCGYRSLVKPRRALEPFEGEPVSVTCLLCGGNVGRCAYWGKHKRRPGVMRDPLLGSRAQQEKARA
jgi:hypothetical protein